MMTFTQQAKVRNRQRLHPGIYDASSWYCPSVWSLLVRVALICSLLPFNALAGNFEIEIKKSQRLLIVRSGEEVVDVFQISSGRGGPGAKQKLGDKKTPVGTYRVMGFNDQSKFDYFIRLNYPNARDALNGLKSGLISRPEFDRIVSALRNNRLPPQNTALGGAIGIHGIGAETPEKLHIHTNLDWTEGCIALKNHEVHRLRPYLGVGTRVVIAE